MKIRNGITFDDVLLAPKYSEIKSRSTINTSVDLGKNIKLDIPIISANMKNITGYEMSTVIASLGGLAIQHRFFDSVEDQVRELNFCESKQRIGVSIGVKEEDKKKLDCLVDAGARIVCVDVAHGDSKLCCEMTEHIAKRYPDLLLISGNVATKMGARRLYNSGADIIKCGIGPGSLCSTRIETGVGVPQLTALEDVYNESCFVSIGNNPINGQKMFTTQPENRKFKIIADGGVRRAGDLMKCLCFSDAVMLGSILAGTDEAPGNIIEKDGVRYKAYEGSSTHKTSHIEGVKAMVPLKGPVAQIINHLMQGIRSGLSYQGVDSLSKLHLSEPEFIRLSGAGLIESHPHDISFIIKD